MKQLKVLIIALALLAPQPAQAGWWETISNWFVERKNAALCAVGIGAACAIVYRIYTAPRRSENELNMLGAREKLVVTALDDLKEEIKKADHPNHAIQTTRVQIQQSLSEDINSTRTYLVIETAKTKVEQDKNQTINAQIAALDDTFNAMIEKIVLDPLEALSKEKIRKAAAVSENDVAFSQWTPDRAIAKVEQIKQSFLAEMRKLKSPSSTPLKPQSPRGKPDKDKDEL
jgi:hypothetical protein